MPVYPGVHSFMEEFSRYVGKGRIGLLTNPSGIDSSFRSTVDLVHSTGQLHALFGPEHGVRGNIQAGEKVESCQDPKTGVALYSLYGKTKKPTEDMLDGVEALVVDLQDVGSRFYTYLYSMLYFMETASDYDLPIVVLDRPNPVGGEVIEGNITTSEFVSFVGYPIPVRYGMTIGELAQYLNAVRNLGAKLTVVPMQGWERHFFPDQTGLPWVPPSPNIPTPDTALVYVGTCLVEGTNLSEGRGTTKPFEVIGAPWIDAELLCRELNGLKLEGVYFRPTYFTPMFSKHQGEMCAGVQIHITSRQTLRPFNMGLHLIATVSRLFPDFAMIEPPSGRKHFFDLLAGTDQVRQYILSNQPITELFGHWRESIEEFSAQRREFLLY